VAAGVAVPDLKSVICGFVDCGLGIVEVEWWAWGDWREGRIVDCGMALRCGKSAERSMTRRAEEVRRKASRASVDVVWW
jgi:hypothetical protein